MSRVVVPRIIKFTYKKHPLSCQKGLLVEYSSSPFQSSREGRSIPQFSVLRQLESWANEVRKSSLATSAGEQKSKSYDRNYITELRALNEYLLEPSDLTGLRMTVRRSANETDPPHRVYWRKDIETKAVAKWGSLEKVALEHAIRESGEDEAKFPVYRRFIMERFKEKQRRRDEKYSRENWPVRQLRLRNKESDKGITGESGTVVLGAIAINTSNFAVKLLAWLWSGSHSMFSEAIHSLADTLNQMILAYGIHKSTKHPTKDHPYGYSNAQYVTALISGVGIFCLGAGVSVYHGIQGLMSPGSMGSLGVALGVLGISFVSESITLGLAIRSIRRSANLQKMTFTEYVLSGLDPAVNVVLLEDAAAVAGVVIAASCMGLSELTGSHIPDAVGSMAIGGLLGAVSAFMISSNSGALVGRSISDERLKEINRELEGDIMVRQVYDVKGIDMGNGLVRYKAEIDWDGVELAKTYLAKQNLKLMLSEIQAVKNEKQLEIFLIKHGEQIVDCLGAEVDRIEKNLKEKHPEVRHVDLEVL